MYVCILPRITEIPTIKFLTWPLTANRIAILRLPISPPLFFFSVTNTACWSFAQIRRRKTTKHFSNNDLMLWHSGSSIVYLLLTSAFPGEAWASHLCDGELMPSCNIGMCVQHSVWFPLLLQCHCRITWFLRGLIAPIPHLGVGFIISTVLFSTRFHDTIRVKGIRIYYLN